MISLTKTIKSLREANYFIGKGGGTRVGDGGMTGVEIDSWDETRVEHEGMNRGWNGDR